MGSGQPTLVTHTDNNRVTIGNDHLVLTTLYWPRCTDQCQCVSVCFRPDMWLKPLETCLLETWKTQFIYGNLLKARTVVNVRVFSWLEISSHSHVSVDNLCNLFCCFSPKHSTIDIRSWSFLQSSSIQYQEWVTEHSLTGQCPLHHWTVSSVAAAHVWNRLTWNWCVHVLPSNRIWRFFSSELHIN